MTGIQRAPPPAPPRHLRPPARRIAAAAGQGRRGIARARKGMCGCRVACVKFVLLVCACACFLRRAVGRSPKNVCVMHGGKSQEDEAARQQRRRRRARAMGLHYVAVSESTYTDIEGREGGCIHAIHALFAHFDLNNTNTHNHNTAIPAFSASPNVLIHPLSHSPITQRQHPCLSLPFCLSPCAPLT